MLNQIKKWNNSGFKEGIVSKTIKYFKLNENENKTSKLWDAAHSELRKFIASNVHIRKEERS